MDLSEQQNKINKLKNDSKLIEKIMSAIRKLSSSRKFEDFFYFKSCCEILKTVNENQEWHTIIDNVENTFHNFLKNQSKNIPSNCYNSSVNDSINDSVNDSDSSLIFQNNQTVDYVVFYVFFTEARKLNLLEFIADNFDRNNSINKQNKKNLQDLFESNENLNDEEALDINL
jgi:hypothetical protein